MPNSSVTGGRDPLSSISSKLASVASLANVPGSATPCESPSQASRSASSTVASSIGASTSGASRSRAARSSSARSAAHATSQLTPPRRTSRPKFDTAIASPLREPAVSVTVADSSLADLAWPTVETARSADHIEIHQLLRAAFHAPSTAEFASQLDQPGYCPSQRLVIRHRREIVSHLRLIPRTLQHDGQQISAMLIAELVTAAPWQRRGLARHLVRAAQQIAREQGAQLLLARSKVSQLFSSLDWKEGSLQWSSLADARQVLAKLALWSHPSQRELFPDDQPPMMFPLGRGAPAASLPVIVRPLRRIDYVALRELYAQASTQMRGWPARSDDYWDWLLGKGSCDSMLVAAVRDPKGTAALGSERLVGYAFAREGRLVEHLVLPGYSDAAEQLLARVCGDVLESDRGEIRVDAPLLSPLHEQLRAAGGQTVTPQQTCGERWMVLPLSVNRLLEQSLPLITERAARAAESKTATLSLRIGTVRSGQQRSDTVTLRAGDETTIRQPFRQYRLQLYRSGVKLVEAAATSPSITCSEACLGMLLLGQWSVESAIARGELQASSTAAAKLAETLFPSQLWHFPPLDDLMS